MIKVIYDLWEKYYQDEIANGVAEGMAAKNAWNKILSEHVGWTKEEPNALENAELKDKSPKAKALWDKVYNDSLAKGDDEETAAKKAYGAIKNAGLYEDKQVTDTSIDKLAKLKKFLEKLGYTIDDTDLEFIDNVKIKKIDSMALERFNLQKVSAVKEQKILVFPRGTFYIEQYQKDITFDDEFFTDIILNYNDPVLSKPFIDKNHKYEESFGNVTGYEIKDDGLYFTIELNSMGVELVKENVYTSISPAFGDVTDTRGVRHRNCLVAISLTNIPALQGELPVLQGQMELEKKMETVMFTKLTRMLELQDAASESAIADAVQALIDAGADQAKVIEALKAEIAKLSAEGADAAKAMDEMSKKLLAVEKKELESEAEKCIDDAIKAGKIHPALKEFKKNAYLANKEMILKELELTPAVKNGVQLSVGSVDNGLTEMERFILNERGLDANNPAHVKIVKDASKE